MTRKETREGGMVFCWSVWVLLTTGAVVTTGYQCDSKERSVGSERYEAFSVPDTGNLILSYRTEHVRNNVTIFFKQQTDASLNISQNFLITNTGNNYKNINISYYEKITTTLVEFMDSRIKIPTTDIPYKVTSVLVGSSNLSWWICRPTSLNHQPATTPTTTTSTTTTAPTTTTTTTTVVETNSSPTPTSTSKPTTHSSTNQSKGLIIALCVVSLLAVVFLLGLAYYCKKSGQPLVAMNDASRTKPNVELEAQERVDNHIYEEWDESYRYQLKKTEDQFERNSINSIYQPFDDNI
ncbi:hypothetical protein Pmani_024531 [Petrolisthes manimaculis]|uniref:Uncharacterized protein n=1 Tax=Petrolisthes manimaculis TaxID=1843537 RepID=A0AAE1P9X1_9EUCA|nr:hypothetical protein Pmani_024531 [Petrolisthes manimaculis]